MGHSSINIICILMGFRKFKIRFYKKICFHEKSGQSRFIWGATISRSCYHEISAQCHLSQNIKSFQTFFFCSLLTFFNGKMELFSKSPPALLILSYCAVLFQMLKQLCGIGSSATAQSRNKRKQKTENFIKTKTSETMKMLVDWVIKCS